jgi:hypothetical protein
MYDYEILRNEKNKIIKPYMIYSSYNGVKQIQFNQQLCDNFNTVSIIIFLFTQCLHQLIYTFISMYSGIDCDDFNT